MRENGRRLVERRVVLSRATSCGASFFAFFLFSLAGAMLCAGADDLVWLFLALELTSLPTYVLVATARDRADAQESAVKYFFLGAMAAGGVSLRVHADLRGDGVYAVRSDHGVCRGPGGGWRGRCRRF